MNWKKRKVIVTGASGFIGSHMVESLVNSGALVTALIKYNSYNDIGSLKYLPGEIAGKIKILPFDVRDPEIMKDLFKGQEVVFHLAALIGIPYSYSHPREVFDVNAAGTINVLLAARENGVEKVVITSTSETYGTARYVPIDENHPLQAQSPYSATKIAGDKIAESFYKTYNFPVAIVRPFNTYGPRQSDRAIIPTIIIQALKKKVIKLGSLTPRRDLLFVEDTVKGFIKAAESNKTLGEPVNIGYGKDISIGELAEKIIKKIGNKVRIETADKRKRPKKSEVMRLLCDNTKARRLLGWKPCVGLDEGLDRTIEWIGKNPEYFNPDKYQI